MKTTISFIFGILILSIVGCNSDNQKINKCFKMYVYPTTLTANQGELFVIYLIAENNCNEEISGNFTLSLPKGMIFNSIYVVGNDTLKKEAPNLIERLENVPPHGKMSSTVVIEVKKCFQFNTKALIKIWASSSEDSAYIDLSKTVFIK